MLRTALGPSIAGWLDDPAVIDGLVRPDLSSGDDVEAWVKLLIG